MQRDAVEDVGVGVEMGRNTEAGEVGSSLDDAGQVASFPHSE